MTYPPTVLNTPTYFTPLFNNARPFSLKMVDSSVITTRLQSHRRGQDLHRQLSPHPHLLPPLPLLKTIRAKENRNRKDQYAQKGKRRQRTVGEDRIIPISILGLFFFIAYCNQLHFLLENNVLYHPRIKCNLEIVSRIKRKGDSSESADRRSFQG